MLSLCQKMEIRSLPILLVVALERELEKNLQLLLSAKIVLAYLSVSTQW